MSLAGRGKPDRLSRCTQRSYQQHAAAAGLAVNSVGAARAPR